MKSHKSVLLVTDISPSNTFASAVILYRHLTNLENNGWHINLILPQSALKRKDFAPTPPTWASIILPNRRWWYPMYRPYGLLQKIRYRIMQEEVVDFIKEKKPDIIIGLMVGTYYSGLSAFLAKKFNIPYFVFYHDKSELFPGVVNKPKSQKIILSNNKKIIDQALVVWTVSKQLIYNTPEWNTKFKVLLPIPEEIKHIKINWQDNFASQPIIAYAGTLYNEVVETLKIIGKLLEKINGKLLIITHQLDNVTVLKQELNNIIYKQPMPTLEVCNYINVSASAMIIAYPEKLEQMPWIESCFPSKFVQFVYTGLPQLILAPKGSALSDWCIENEWAGYINDYSIESINALLKSITYKENWEKLSLQAIEYSKTAFDAESIQDVFEEDIMTKI
jgi:glycosyltransferase involved in cell wall biosynthesis